MKSIISSLKWVFDRLSTVRPPKVPSPNSFNTTPQPSQPIPTTQPLKTVENDSPSQRPKPIQSHQSSRPSETFGMSGFTDANYNQNADKAIDLISDICDGLAEKFPKDIREVNLDGGVLEVDTRRGKFILNKQAPSKQIWLSSPISGPHHYDMITFPKMQEVLWTSKKDDQDLFSRLEHEFSRISKMPIAFDV